MTHGLIIDVGMHDGSDTEFYLRKGFRVVGIEANPDSVARASERLSSFIESGQLVIKQCAVASYEGETEFLVSDRSLWSSLPNSFGERGGTLGVGHRTIVVPCRPFRHIIEGFETPDFVKIDIEGADLDCLRDLVSLPEVPRYVSFECNSIVPEETFEALSLLTGRGYNRFKLVNQALNPQIRLPNPPLEGDYVDVRFDHNTSGAFGEEAPGPWQSEQVLRERFEALCKQQALRSKYEQTGNVFGIPVGRFHAHLERLYHQRLVKAARSRYAAIRGRELGGWFDIHAAL